ncbi:unnamed protein product [Brassicogethes aeneus]|uniref:C2H2-type domain-containing protein n=1 Tax=Brassicogethes aeneus TaxID=1431903 RepID=A0A9P0AQ97_BRAAE|nr:unnamed protein product [Brassicogethes aeneus]
MESENYSTAYLLNEDEFPDNFSVEHIFTPVDSSDWRNDNFPVLLTNSLEEENTAKITETFVPNENLLLTDADEDILLQLNNDISTKKSEIIDNTPFITYTQESIENNENLIVTEGSDDILLNIDDDTTTPVQQEVQNVKNNTYLTCNSILKKEHAKKSSSNANTPIVHLVDNRGNILSLNKSMLIIPPKNNDNKSKELNYKDFYSEINAYRCKICKFLCETVNDIKVHILEKHSEKMLPVNPKNLSPKTMSILNTNNTNKKTTFLCSVCRTGCPSKEELRIHMINIHNLSDSKKEENDSEQSNNTEKKIVKTVRSISESLVKKQQKSLKRVKCTIKGCDSRFAKEEIRKRHEACHVDGNKKQFQCSECQEKFSIWRICSSHMWKCHKIDMGVLICPMCNDFKTVNTAILKAHMAIHNDEKPFLCSECGKSFKQISQLKNHEVTHKRGTVNLPNWSTMKQCEICDRVFVNNKSYTKHVKFVHEKIKPYICSICGHKTSTKAMLELHHRQHTGAKPYECKMCSYKTGDHNSLRRHKMRHFGGVQYNCPYCDYSSIQSAAFKSHLSSRHPDKEGTLKCDHCKYSTLNFPAFLSHLKCHQVVLNTTTSQEDKGGILLNTVIITTNDTTVNQSNKTDNALDIEDDETQNCFLNMDTTEDAIDTGGITIPAGLELPLELNVS